MFLIRLTMEKRDETNGEHLELYLPVCRAFRVVPFHLLSKENEININPCDNQREQKGLKKMPSNNLP